MSQRDNFTGGFLLGTLVGGVVGGVIGALAASRRNSPSPENPSLLQSGKGEKFSTEESMETARRRLEEKIAQLNLVIDDVREQLGNVNGTPTSAEMSPESGNQE